MKSHFAKIIDSTLGAVLLFAVATAVLRYYLPLYVSTVTAGAITAGIYFMASTLTKKRNDRETVSRAADDMFFDFMFSNAAAPAKRLQAGLNRRGVKSELHGDALYCNNTAAFFFFDAPPTDKQIARAVSRATHYGKRSIIVFSKFPAQIGISPDGIKITAVHGDDVYRLFASLDALPPRRFDKTKRAGRFSAFRGALDKDKTVRYLLLSLALFAVARLTRFSVAVTVCAGISALLFVSSIVFNIVRAVRSTK